MFRKSGSRFSEKDMRKRKAHVPEKWQPVFRKGHAQTQKANWLNCVTNRAALQRSHF